MDGGWSYSWALSSQVTPSMIWDCLLFLSRFGQMHISALRTRRYCYVLSECNCLVFLKSHKNIHSLCSPESIFKIHPANNIWIGNSGSQKPSVQPSSEMRKFHVTLPLKQTMKWMMVFQVHRLSHRFSELLSQYAKLNGKCVKVIYTQDSGFL